jgi:hypothetical protein
MSSKHQSQQPDRAGSRRERSVIGWREWVCLPELGVARIKAKVDTGARSSSLHAFDIQYFERDGRQFVRFRLHPLQRNTRLVTVAEAEVIEFRPIKSSTGHVTSRPVVRTQIQLMGSCWPIEVTLASRDEMGFRMLLGREAVRGRFVVDAGGSYFGGKMDGHGQKERPRS